MKREDFSELAALYALDLLEEQNCGLVEEAIAQFPDLQTELAEFQLAVSAIAYSSPPVPLATNLKDRLFQRIAISEEDTTTKSTTSVSALKEKAAVVDWEPHSIPGVMIGKLSLDLEKREIVCFVRAKAGMSLPKHRHAGNEEIVVLEGDLVFDGEIYGSGECIRSGPGSAHQPETYGGFLIFLRTSLDDEIIIV